MASALTQKPKERLKRFVLIGLFVLALRGLILIILEYRWYFPPDFQKSNFLITREPYFFGYYGTAFYIHIIASPIAILLSFLLVVSGPMMIATPRPRLQAAHRWSGRALAILVVLLVAPSGMILALHSFAGIIAGLGFISLSIATLAFTVTAANLARSGKITAHRKWAFRTFLLLVSPLILRTMTGICILLDIESNWTYRVSAWASWLLPLLIYEAIDKVRSLPLAVRDLGQENRNPASIALKGNQNESI